MNQLAVFLSKSYEPLSVDIGKSHSNIRRSYNQVKHRPALLYKYHFKLYILTFRSISTLQGESHVAMRVSNVHSCRDTGLLQSVRLYPLLSYNQQYVEFRQEITSAYESNIKGDHHPP